MELVQKSFWRKIQFFFLYCCLHSLFKTLNSIFFISYPTIHDCICNNKFTIFFQWRLGIFEPSVCLLLFFAWLWEGSDPHGWAWEQPAGSTRPGPAVDRGSRQSGSQGVVLLSHSQLFWVIALCSSPKPHKFRPFPTPSTSTPSPHCRFGTTTYPPPIPHTFSTSGSLRGFNPSRCQCVGGRGEWKFCESKFFIKIVTKPLLYFKKTFLTRIFLLSLQLLFFISTVFVFIKLL